MNRAWVAILDEPAPDADAQAALAELGGVPAGWLAAWLRKAKPVRQARRADPRLIDPDGEAAILSVVWPDRERGLLAFDDLAVQQARRAVLASATAPDAVSTVLVDDSHFAGAITVWRDQATQDDPFARVEPARRLRVGAGVVGAFALPVGPVIERHGSAQPWPWERF
jgi:hypothetical protein